MGLLSRRREPDLSRLVQEAVEKAIAGRGASASTDVSGRAAAVAQLQGTPGGYGGPMPAPPDAVEAAVQEQTRPAQPFSPQRPLNPYFGYSTEPRAWDFPTGYNLATRPRSTQGRISFDTLRQMYANYDVARMCVEHRQDDIRSLDWHIVAAHGVEEDVDWAIEKARKFMAKPDGVTPFDSWQSSFLEDRLRYDAGTLYRRRNNRGDVIAVEVVDGTTIAPLLDYYGRRPAAPAPAFAQFANGVPWDWLTEADLVYQPFRLQPNSPYGLPPMEWLIVNSNTDIRFQLYFLHYFTEGSVPDTFMEAPEGLTDPEQIETLQKAWDALMEGDQAQKHKVKWIPFGAKPHRAKDDRFDYQFPLFLMRKTCAAHKVTPNDVGFTDDVNRATGETQTDVQFRIGTRPDAMSLKGIYDRILQDDLGLPVQFLFDLGEEKEDRLDEARVWDYYVRMGAASPDEPRAKVLGLPVDPARPVPRFVVDRSGVVPLVKLFADSGKVEPGVIIPEGSRLDELAAEGDIMTAPDAAGDLTDVPEGAVEDDSGTVAPIPQPKPSPDGAVRKDLARWRENARHRIRKGKRPREFDSDVIPGDMAEAVWERLCKAATREEVDAAFAAIEKAAPVPKAGRADRRAAVESHYQARITAALVRMVGDVQSLVEGYVQRHPVVKAQRQPDPEEIAAAAYLAASVAFDDDDLAGALDDLYADGYTAGVELAQSRVSARGGAVKVESDFDRMVADIDWSRWQPGNPAAARELAGTDGGRGLAQLLADDGAVIRGISGTLLDDIAAALARGAAAGDNVQTLAKSIRDLVGDPERAARIAVTELTRAVSVATLDTYRRNGIAGKSWSTAADERVCALCDGNEGDGTIPVNATFSSGDDSPPGHTLCRCTLEPDDLPVPTETD